jgi:hypothetical protein
VDFLLMMIGALVTYAKAIIGLAFLFGIAPLFFIFLLFDRSRAIFFQWTYEVLTMALQPVMLFAFLSFYVALITAAAPNLLTAPNFNGGSGTPTDFCWLKWFSVPGTLWEMFVWHPTYNGTEVTQGYTDPQGNQLPEPVNVANVLYFLMLCHLGRTFTKFIEQLSTDLGGGTGAGVLRGSDIQRGASKFVKKVRNSL